MAAKKPLTEGDQEKKELPGPRNTRNENFTRENLLIWSDETNVRFSVINSRSLWDAEKVN